MYDSSPTAQPVDPPGLAMAPDGALYVSDDVHGRIWRVSYRGGDATDRLVSAPKPVVAAASPNSPLPPEGMHPDAGRQTAARVFVEEPAQQGPDTNLPGLSRGRQREAFRDGLEQSLKPFGLDAAQDVAPVQQIPDGAGGLKVVFTR